MAKKAISPIDKIGSITDEKLITLAFVPIAEVYDMFETSANGISTEKIESLEESYGKNIIVAGKPKTLFKRLLEAFVNPFNIILFFVSIVSLFTDVVFSDNKDYLTFSIILVLIFVASIISFVQSEKSNNAANKLAGLISNTCHIYRDNQLMEVKIQDIYPGDIIKLSSGDMIPADIRFIKTKDCYVSQSALTGESLPIEKFTHINQNATENITDLLNIGFLGTNIISGTALGVVLSTGNQTLLGSMAKSITSVKSKNAFEKGIDSISKLLLIFMSIMVPLVLLINILFSKPWLDALLFSVTMAVGLVPIMLPVIVSSTLAKSAIKMSKEKVIVKSLSSIQTFGQIDILCTDKTGTLTEDKIVLEKYMDIIGNDNMRVLRHAYLNASFQTGLKNLIDIAIINRATESGFNDLLKQYLLTDEIPFDFQRRRMSVVLTDKSGKTQLITKGSFDEILSICKYAELNGQIVPFTDEIKEKCDQVYEKHSSLGLRIIAVCQKNNIPDAKTLKVEDESEMVLIGFMAFLDPPKESVRPTLEKLKARGIRVVVLTGDSIGVTRNVCRKVGIEFENVIIGKDLDLLTDEGLKNLVEKNNVFAKLSPAQKQRIIKHLQERGHTVGYLGDGINDAPSLQQADIGISVDSGVDIAKETANIILLEKDLNVLTEGVIQGRITYGNIMKYIKMAASGNFGNMISLLVISIFLPFLPLLPIHIIAQNLLSDTSQLGMPFDNVDKEYTLKPKKWNTKGVSRFMLVLGPVSSIFDILCFISLYFILGFNSIEKALLFQTGWFLFGILSQISIVHMIRTEKVPIFQSRSSLALTLSTLLVSFLAILFTFTRMGVIFELAVLPVTFLPYLIVLLLGYFLLVQLVKFFFLKLFKEWY